MNRLTSLYRSSIGKKFIAAVTGLILFGFLVGHVAGNLKVFTGADADGVPHIDSYGAFLRIVGEPFLPAMFGLWIARSVLLVSLILHVAVVIQLSWQSKKARPIGYVRSKKSAASLPAMYMMFSGSVILFFIVFHILHFTAGALPFLGDFEHGQVYNNLANSFANPVVGILYIFFMVVLAFHLYHGVWSLFQTLGLDNPDRNKALRMFALVASIGIAAGLASIPIAYMLGAVPAESYEYSHKLLENH